MSHDSVQPDIDLRQLRRSRSVLILFVLTFPLVLFASTQTTARFRNELTEWADPAALPTQQFRDYREWFGANEYVLMTWRGCTRDQAVLDTLRDRLQNDAKIRDLVDSVTSGRSVFRGLTKAAKLDEDTATLRLQRTILGPDGLTTGLALGLSDAGRYQRETVFREINTILEEEGISTDAVHFAGLGHDLFVLDDEGFRSPFRMVPAIIISALLLTWFFVRDLRLACFINALGIYAGAMSFTLIFFSTINLNAIVWPLPTLLMLLTVSACLHFLGYYRNALNHQAKTTSHADLVRESVRHARKPIIYCAMTTAVGLLSLCLSSTRPVRQFGFFGCLSVIIANGSLLLCLPAWLTVFPPKSRNRGDTLPASNDGPSLTDRFWRKLAWFTDRFRWPIIVSMIGGMLLLGSGIPSIRTGGNLRNFFPRGHRVLTDAATIEANVGPLSSIDLLLRFDNPQRRNDFERIRKIDQLSNAMLARSEVEATLSAATFSPVWQTDTTGSRRIRDVLQLNKLRDLLTDYKLFAQREDANLEVWRVSLRYSGLSEVDVVKLKEQAARVARETFAPGGQCVFTDEHFEAIPTGEFALFDHVDRQFLTDLIITYSTAFALISVVMLLLLHSPQTMLLVAFPNVFPAMVVLGIGGWLSQSLDVASLMTASVALGIAVDDTLHFVLWYRKRIDAGDSQSAAIEDAMRHCGAAMIQTSVACGFSIVLYAFCGFLPTVRFGILLCSMLLMALVGDLLLLPALLSLNRADHS